MLDCVSIMCQAVYIHCFYRPPYEVVIISTPISELWKLTKK